MIDTFIFEAFGDSAQFFLALKFSSRANSRANGARAVLISL